MITKDLYERFAKPPHPGAILRDEILPRLGLNGKTFAGALCLSPRIVYALLKERRSITPDMAARLDRVIGGGVHYWLGLQCRHDIEVARLCAQQLMPGVRKLVASGPSTKAATRASGRETIGEPHRRLGDRGAKSRVEPVAAFSPAMAGPGPERGR
ncbi:MAG: HigA family addiction module antitoxin [Hyphomicrobiaceae bacterium]